MGFWRIFGHLSISVASEYHEARRPVPRRSRGSRRRLPETGGCGPSPPELWKTMMFSLFRRKAPKTTAYTWKPALDLTDPRISAILLTFGRA